MRCGIRTNQAWCGRCYYGFPLSLPCPAAGHAFTLPPHPSTPRAGALELVLSTSWKSGTHYWGATILRSARRTLRVIPHYAKLLFGCFEHTRLQMEGILHPLIHRCRPLWSNCHFGASYRNIQGRAPPPPPLDPARQLHNPRKPSAAKSVLSHVMSAREISSKYKHEPRTRDIHHHGWK